MAAKICALAILSLAIGPVSIDAVELVRRETIDAAGLMRREARTISKAQDKTPLQCTPAAIKSGEVAGVMLAEKEKDGTMLIIGANTGADSNDPIWQYLIGGHGQHLDKVYVEPLPPHFKKLQENIRSLPRALAVNAAITNKSGTLPFYCVGLDMKTGGLTEKAKQSKAPWWWSQCCSLSRKRFHNPYDMGKTAKERQSIQDLVTEVKVQAYTPEDLIKKYITSPVRYLSIDTECLDAVIIDHLPFETNADFRPATIVFEHTCMDAGRYNAVLARLQRFGYTSCTKEFQNTIAVRV